MLQVTWLTITTCLLVALLPGGHNLFCLITAKVAAQSTNIDHCDCCNHTPQPPSRDTQKLPTPVCHCHQPQFPARIPAPWKSTASHALVTLLQLNSKTPATCYPAHSPHPKPLPLPDRELHAAPPPFLAITIILT